MRAFARGSVARVLRAVAMLAAGLTGASALAATITVNSNADTVANDGVCTLREAIIAANTDTASGGAAGECAAGSGTDTIQFAIPGGGVHTITLGGSPLPTITQPVTIDGYTQAGASQNTLATGDNAVLVIEIDASSVAPGSAVINITGGNTTIRGLDIHGNAGTTFALIAVQSAANNVIEGNFIGINPDGTTGASGNGNGVSIFGAGTDNNRVGGTLPGQRNVISGNGGGVTFGAAGTGNTIQGNYIGTDRNGTAALPNFRGITAQSTGTMTIGGAAANAGNLVSGNTDTGIFIVGFGVLTGTTTVQGNFIGTNATGTAALSNANIGIEVNETSGQTMGPVLIGGTAVGAGNLISGNGQVGIFTVDGVAVSILGNLVGTNVSGSGAVGNGLGIQATGASTFNGDVTIGDGTPAGRNIVSGNTGGPGIQVTLTTATIRGNYVGVAVDGATPLANAGTGIVVDSSTAIVGGTSAGQGNIIANSGNAGVVGVISFSAIHNASNAQIRGNSIYNNALLGIDLSVSLINGDGVTPNDTGDADTGPNNLQNFPVLNTPVIAAGNVTLSGTLNSTPNADFNLDFYSNAACDASGSGEGQSYLGSHPVTTDGAGNVSFSGVTLPIPPGQTFITATATDTNNPASTSEFSACVSPAGGLPTLSINNVSQNEGNSGTTPFVFTVTLSAASASTVTVNYATADGTATAPSDYAATSGTLTFNPGVTTQTITVNVVGDVVVEPNETFSVTLSSPSNATIATGTGTGTIFNDDAAGLPSLSINNVSANEGNSGITPFTFTVTLSAASASTVTVNFATADGSATAPGDYSATSGTLRFAPGVTTQTVTVNVNGDTTVEPNETFVVNLTGAVNATIAFATGVGTILNDDIATTAPSVVIPTLSEWAVALLALLLMVGAAMQLSRRARRR